MNFLKISYYIKYIYYFLFVIFLLINVSCTVYKVHNAPAFDYNSIDELTVNDKFSKVCYEPVDKTFFCMQQRDNSISIYRNGKLVNRIGGTGFADENFQGLIDIQVGIDGSLYALDRNDKKIKRFDRNGRLLNMVEMSNVTQPTRFSFSDFGDLFIYDNANKEIVVFESLRGRARFRFGKFDNDHADYFFHCGEYLNIYNKDSNKTTVYSAGGRYENTFYSFSFYDSYMNVISLSNNVNFFGAQFLSLTSDFLVIEENNKIKVLRLIYEKN